MRSNASEARSRWDKRLKIHDLTSQIFVAFLFIHNLNSREVSFRVVFDEGVRKRDNKIFLSHQTHSFVVHIDISTLTRKKNV